MPSALDAFLQAAGGAVAAALAPANRAPTAVALTNAIAAIDENTATASHIKVADIVVIDDGLGTNTLGLTGTDAAFFEIVGTSLYIKAGTVLNYEAKTSYSVAVTVDDTSVGTMPDATSATYTLAVGNVVDTALEFALVAIGGVIGGAITPTNLAPTAAVLTNAVASIDETTATASHIKVADIAVIDDALGTNTLGLTGADAAFFEIVGTSLYLKAGTVLDFETKASYAVAVTADDTTAGTTPDAASATYTLAVADVNEAPTAVALANTTAAIDETTATASHIKVADIAVTDDGLGTNTLGLTGADAAFFEIEGTSLYLKAGTVLDFETKASYAVAVTADDTTVGTTPDATSATYTLAVADVSEAMPHIRGYTGPGEALVAPSAPVDLAVFVRGQIYPIPDLGTGGSGTPLIGQGGPSVSRAFSASPANPFDPSSVPHQDDSFAFSHQTDPFAFTHESDPFAGRAFPAPAPVFSLQDIGLPILRGALTGPHEDFLLS